MNIIPITWYGSVWISQSQLDFELRKLSLVRNGNEFEGRQHKLSVCMCLNIKCRTEDRPSFHSA